MGHSQAAKREGHDRILGIAAKRFREGGLDRVSIADLMHEAGLTHGGFYKHFESRDDLVIQALQHAFQESASRGNEGVKKRAKRPTLEAVVKEYLSKDHRDSPGTGCAVGALVSDAGRAAGDTRDTYTEQVKRNLRAVAHVIGDPAEGNDLTDAIVILSALVGAIGLARAVSDQRLSNDILKSVSAHLIAAFEK